MLLIQKEGVRELGRDAFDAGFARLLQLDDAGHVRQVQIHHIQ